MHSPEVEQKQVKVLLLCQDILGIVLDLLKDFWLDLLFLIENFRHQALAQVKVSLNRVIWQLWSNHNVLSMP